MFLPRPGNLWVTGGSALGVREEAVELAASGIERDLLLLRAVMNERAALLMDLCAQQSGGREFSERRVFVEITDEFATQQPKVVDMLADGLGSKTGFGQTL